MRHLLLATAVLLVAASPTLAQTPEQTVAAALASAPIWDGHNDVPEQLRNRRHDLLTGFDFTNTTGTADPANDRAAMQTDLSRIKAGHLGAQFWSVYVSAALPEPQAVQATMEQIDLTKRLVARYPDAMQFCTDTACVASAWKAHKLASLMGMEGGHSIGGSLAVLRQMYALGARYMTLTHFKNNAWADSGTDKPEHNGLTPFGKDVVREMQRLGMLVDLSHVSEKTMLDAMDVAGAPVIFSHSNARAINHHSRNATDTVLDRLKGNGGVIMVNFYPGYIVEESRQWSAARAAEKARLDALYLGDPAGAATALAAWGKANPMPLGTIANVADHIDYIARRIGADHVGLGGDIDGVDVTVKGFEDVSDYPALLTELALRGWSQSDLEKLASGNIMRVMKAAEAYAAAHKADLPIENATTF
jgi:membrane dipeptidase